jgi:Multimeric flavodoxin WrbA
MRIVVLSGSPHKLGTTSKLADSFIAGAREAGHVITRFDTAFLSVHPCLGCDHCKGGDHKCVFRDAMTEIGTALAESECIAFVTPIYYYGICAQLKTVIDRFYAIEESIRKNQKTVFLTAMADNDPESVLAANGSYRAITRWMNWNDCGIVNAFACAVPQDLEGTDYETKAFALGKNL